MITSELHSAQSKDNQGQSRIRPGQLKQGVVGPGLTMQKGHITSRMVALKDLYWAPSFRVKVESRHIK